ncbi:MAG: hypothetical protein K2X38_22705 [Gemmataceae bacterium]|nr:hypothetical protein [Gemmataceae bacterium]
MSDYDQRQYRLMLQQLERFEQGKATLSDLIASLDALLSVLESTEENWKEAFRYEWGTLETEYAISLDRGEPVLPSESMSLVHQAVANMEALLRDRVSADESALHES